MTEHRLTDEMCEVIATVNPWSGDVVYLYDDMRAAADWQLEEVETSVERRIQVLRQSGYVFAADAVEDFFQGIMQNMRPQQDDNE